ALLPGAIRTTTPEILPQPVAEQPESTTIVHTEEISSEQIALPVHIAEEISPMSGAEPRQIRDRNDALERLRVIRRWFEHSEPSSPTIPLLRQAERLVGKRFSEVINEIPVELLEKWDALE
ncbi:cytoplasmic protein, partial [Escherichia coli]